METYKFQLPVGPNGQEQPQQKLASSLVSGPVPAPASDPVASAAADAIVKMEPTAVEPHSINLSGDNASTSRKKLLKKFFQKRKKSSERIRDKKQRQNRMLRKSMLPKDALMALNEAKGVTISDFTIDRNPEGGFTAVVTVNSNQYKGEGVTKRSAKNAACEQAWRDFIIGKMKKAKLPPANSSDTNAAESMDTNDDDDESPENDLPMINLASFAIHKLFSEWERDGYIVPKMHPSGADASVPGDADAPPAPVPPRPPVRAELPIGWKNLHPVTVLSIMRPGITYVDRGTSGEKTNVMQNLGIVVDDQEFTASGRSKKIARRNVAVSVCNTLFGTNFSIENPTA